MSWPNRAKDLAKGGLIILALVLGFVLAVGVFQAIHGSSCDRLDAERISHLKPGHTTRGPDGVNVIGIEPGPPPSQITAYWEAVSAMRNAGCVVPGED